MDYLKWIWFVLKHLFGVLLLLGIYSTLYETFEIVVVSLLVLIFSRIIYLRQGVLIGFETYPLQFAEEFRRVKQLIFDVSKSDKSNIKKELEEEYDSIVKHQKAAEKNSFHNLIELVPIWIYSAIAIFHIVFQVV